MLSLDFVVVIAVVVVFFALRLMALQFLYQVVLVDLSAFIAGADVSSWMCYLLIADSQCIGENNIAIV
jgi:hypothetical protein